MRLSQDGPATIRITSTPEASPPRPAHVAGPIHRAHRQLALIADSTAATQCDRRSHPPATVRRLTNPPTITHHLNQGSASSWIEVHSYMVY